MVTMTFEKRMKEFSGWVNAFGYRTPTVEDLLPRTEFLMVDIGRYLECGQGRNFKVTSSATSIRLDDKPIHTSDDGRKQVLYHCIQPRWDGQCFTPIEDFLASDFCEGMYANETRYLVKK